MKIVGCFLEFDGKFVILLRHPHKPNGGTWGLPAGKVENGEDNAAATLRELREETGYHGSLQELEHLGDYDFGTDDSRYTFAAYRVQLKNPHELTVEDAAHGAYRWVTPQECYELDNLIPDFHELLEKLAFVKSTSL